VKDEAAGLSNRRFPLQCHLRRATSAPATHQADAAERGQHQQDWRGNRHCGRGPAERVDCDKPPVIQIAEECIGNGAGCAQGEEDDVVTPNARNRIVRNIRMVQLRKMDVVLVLHSMN